MAEPSTTKPPISLAVTFTAEGPQTLFNVAGQDSFRPSSVAPETRAYRALSAHVCAEVIKARLDDHAAASAATPAASQPAPELGWFAKLIGKKAVAPQQTGPQLNPLEQIAEQRRIAKAPANMRLTSATVEADGVVFGLSDGSLQKSPAKSEAAFRFAQLVEEMAEAGHVHVGVLEQVNNLVGRATVPLSNPRLKTAAPSYVAPVAPAAPAKSAGVSAAPASSGPSAVVPDPAEEIDTMPAESGEVLGLSAEDEAAIASGNLLPVNGPKTPAPKKPGAPDFEDAPAQEPTEPSAAPAQAAAAPAAPVPVPSPVVAAEPAPSPAPVARPTPEPAKEPVTRVIKAAPIPAPVPEVVEPAPAPIDPTVPVAAASAPAAAPSTPPEGAASADESSAKDTAAAKRSEIDQAPAVTTPRGASPEVAPVAAKEDRPQRVAPAVILNQPAAEHWSDGYVQLRPNGRPRAGVPVTMTAYGEKQGNEKPAALAVVAIKPEDLAVICWLASTGRNPRFKLNMTPTEDGKGMEATIAGAMVLNDSKVNTPVDWKKCVKDFTSADKKVQSTADANAQKSAEVQSQVVTSAIAGVRTERPAKEEDLKPKQKEAEALPPLPRLPPLNVPRAPARQPIAQR